MSELRRKLKQAETGQEIKLIMAEHGWRSTAEITDIGWGGEFGYSIHFHRYEWHGAKPGPKASYHAHTSNLEQIDETILKAALIADKAWEEYKNCPPKQMSDGSLLA